MMQRVVIDTNVLVSSLIQQSFPYLVINYVLHNSNIEWCISDEVLREYQNVLKRAKFSKYLGFVSKAEKLLATIEIFKTKFAQNKKLYIIKDVDDNKFLELALESKAHYLITGNTLDFTLEYYELTKIVTPKEFWENCKI